MRLIGPVLLIWVLWRYGDTEALLRAFTDARLWPLAGAVLLNVFPIHLKLWRWRTLLTQINAGISTASAYRAYLPSLFLGLVTPGRIGDVLRIQYLRYDHGVSYARGLAVSVIDRLCDVYVLLAFFTLGFVHLTKTVAAPPTNTAWIAVILLGLAPVLLLYREFVESSGRWLYRRFSNGHTPEGLTLFFAALKALLTPRLAGPLAVTVVAFLTNYLQAWLVALSLGIDLALVDVIALVAISSFLSLLPISISGLGVRESFFAFAFPLLGLSETLGIAFGLGVFAVIYVVNLVVGFIAWQIWPPRT